MSTTIGLAAILDAASFRQLLAEQTTPAEVLNFIVVVVVGALVTATLVYAAVMSALWAIRLRPRVRYRTVLLPTRDQFAEYAGEYLLALGTSVLLSVTLITRHTLVEEILSHPLPERHATQLQELLPHLSDPAAALRGGTVASVFLRPLLEAGRTADAYALAASVVGELGEGRLSAFPTRNTLVYICAAMMLAYLAWLARGRYRQLREPEPNEPQYARTARGLLTLAACIGLLLLAPTLDRGLEAAVESVLGAAKVRGIPPEAEPIVAQVRAAIVEDQEAGGPMRRADLDQLRASVANLQREHASMNAVLRGLSDAGPWQDSMRVMAGLWRDYERRLRALEVWHANGTLLVFAPAALTYYVRSAAGRALVASNEPNAARGALAARATFAQRAASGMRVLQMRVSPGRYRISRNPDGSVPIDSVTVRAGEITATWLTQPVP